MEEKVKNEERMFISINFYLTQQILVEWNEGKTYFFFLNNKANEWILKIKFIFCHHAITMIIFFKTTHIITIGGKKKPLKAPKKDAKELDEVS